MSGINSLNMTENFGLLYFWLLLLYSEVVTFGFYNQIYKIT